MNTKKSVILYIIVLFIVLAGMSFHIKINGNIISFMLWVLRGILILVFSLYGCTKIFPYLQQNKQATKALDALNQCNPKASIALHTQWYQDLKKKRFVRKYLVVCVNNLAVSYQNDGDITTAISLLDGIIPIVRTEQEHILVHGNLAAFSLENNYPSEFLRKMEIVNFNLQKLIERGKVYESVKAFVDNLNMQYAVYQGEYEKSLAFFRDSVTVCPNLFGKCNSMFKQACIYEKLGDTEKQAECLKYVADNGNDLYIARTARGKLEQLLYNGIR